MFVSWRDTCTFSGLFAHFFHGAPPCGGLAPRPGSEMAWSADCASFCGPNLLGAAPPDASALAMKLTARRKLVIFIVQSFLELCFSFRSSCDRAVLIAEACTPGAWLMW